MKRLATVSMVVLGLSVLSGTASADNARGKHHHGGGASIFMLRALDLTETERTQIHQVLAAHEPKFDALRQELRQAREHLAARGPELAGPAYERDA